MMRPQHKVMMRPLHKVLAVLFFLLPPGALVEGHMAAHTYTPWTCHHAVQPLYVTHMSDSHGTPHAHAMQYSCGTPHACHAVQLWYASHAPCSTAVVRLTRAMQYSCGTPHTPCSTAVVRLTRHAVQLWYTSHMPCSSEGLGFMKGQVLRLARDVM